MSILLNMNWCICSKHIDEETHGIPQGVDSSYNVLTNVSVRRGIIWGINVHSINKGEVSLMQSLSCILQIKKRSMTFSLKSKSEFNKL